MWYIDMHFNEMFVIHTFTAAGDGDKMRTYDEHDQWAYVNGDDGI